MAHSVDAVDSCVPMNDCNICMLTCTIVKLWNENLSFLSIL